MGKRLWMLVSQGYLIALKKNNQTNRMRLKLLAIESLIINDIKPEKVFNKIQFELGYLAIS